jgi:hypothetical protein
LQHRGIAGEPQRERFVIGEIVRHQLRQADCGEQAGADAAGERVALAGQDRQSRP